MNYSNPLDKYRGPVRGGPEYPVSLSFFFHRALQLFSEGEVHIPEYLSRRSRDKYSALSLCYFIRYFNWLRAYDVTANNCLRIIVLLQIVVSSCAVQTISNDNGSALLRVIGERFYLFTATKNHC